uniref:Hydrophobic seed protein domain-containing protein n=1 Tax=Setaria viridis TaxID=4556 RepID=A0A4U6UJ64_SETVI|nr:hypothetical protein SEVIR_5G190801v2 [Setaria viridis]
MRCMILHIFAIYLPSFQVMRPCGKLWARCAHLRAANRHG